MNPELKAKWVAALRSGEYRQCRYRLRDGAGYCCLGVLHKVRFNAEPPELYQPNLDIFSSVQLADEETYRLSCMNDDGKTFAEIADYIEEKL